MHYAFTSTNSDTDFMSQDRKTIVWVCATSIRVYGGSGLIDFDIKNR